MEELKEIITRTKDHTRATKRGKIPDDARQPLMTLVYEWKERDPSHRAWIRYVRDWSTTGEPSDHWTWKEEAAHLKEDLLWLLEVIRDDFSMHHEREIWPIAGWVLSRALEHVPPRTNTAWEE